MTLIQCVIFRLPGTIIGLRSRQGREEVAFYLFMLTQPVLEKDQRQCTISKQMSQATEREEKQGYSRGGGRRGGGGLNLSHPPSDPTGGKCLHQKNANLLLLRVPPLQSRQTPQREGGLERGTVQVSLHDSAISSGKMKMIPLLRLRALGRIPA